MGDGRRNEVARPGPARLGVFLDRGPVLLDGAMGTQLIAAGLRPGECPETWNTARPEAVRRIHQAYLEAGARVVTTNTFGANRRKLSAFGLGRAVAELNQAGVRLAREAVAAAGGNALVAGDVGPTGEFVEPFGPLSFAETYDVYREQIEALAAGGVDFIFLETFSDLGEARAAVLAARDAGIPVACTFTFDAHGRTLLGADPETVAVVLEGLGAIFLGANCSLGPRELVPLIRRMAAVARVPVAVQPNAGLPRLEAGRAVYPQGPEEFGRAGEELLAAGATLVGGCCGTTPDHIRALRRAVEAAGKGGAPRVAGGSRRTLLAGPGGVVAIGPEELPVVIGERLNPTARKRLAEAVRAREFGVYRDEAKAQVAAGAKVLDLNVGVPGVDEAAAMRAAVAAVEAAVPVPLSIDSANAQALAAGLEIFHGRALLNSVNGKEEVLAEVLPLARRYGAAVLGLTLDERGIPPRAEERLAIARRIVAAAEAAGLRREELLIDCLVLAAGAQQAEVAETLRAVRLIREELGVGTVLGVSNVSHGLPGRSLLNATFLAMALGAGLDAAIVNPLDARVWETLQAGAVLVNRDRHARVYLATQPKEERRPQAADTAGSLPAPAAARMPEPPPAAEGDSVAALYRAIVEGEAEKTPNLVAKALAGSDPLEIVDRAVVPALEEVGRRYEAGEYFLPQLMLSADAARAAFAELKPHLARGGAPAGRGTVVLATVEGDIHDIGKNIVAVMLENHGFRVVDLGRDVPAARVVEAARAERAGLVGLSALMTTTMVGMGRVIEALQAAGLPAKVMVGGAVVTEEFARQIGADGYGRDAVAAVRLAQELTAGRERG
ncbi:MAG: homocysteine S-methyltransferase family protein [Bacillota bacterium]|nr:homocysteine S-methyltransferase family protein [Bacillota bacterium]